MDLRNIKTFIRVAELGSFTKAAEEMNYVQSTVTMQVKQLEKELGYPLFDRIGKRVSLTLLGKEFMSYAYEMLNLLDKAENLASSPEEIHGVLRVGVSESLMLGVLMELLPLFKEKYKNMELSLKTGHTTELLEELKQNRLDILYISKSINTDTDLFCCYAREEELIFVAGKEHKLAKKSNISVEELMCNEFLVTEHEGICYNRLCELAAQHGATLIDSVEVDSVYVISELVKSGMGIAFLPQYAVEKYLSKGEIVKLEVNIKPQIYYSQILCHKSRWISPFIKGFIDMIKNTRPINI